MSFPSAIEYTVTGRNCRKGGAERGLASESRTRSTLFAPLGAFPPKLGPPIRVNFLEWNDRFVRKKQNSLSSQANRTDQYIRGSPRMAGSPDPCTLRRALDA